MSKRIAAVAVLPARLGPKDAFELALSDPRLVVSDQSALWLSHLLLKLGRFLESGRSVYDIEVTTRIDVAAWVDAPLSDGSRPSLATRHNRRSAASAGFRILRDLGLVDHDPTVDVDLPLRSRGRNTRPLTDDELAAGRAASVGTLSATRLPAVWALAEATATTHEIPRVLPCHVDLDGGTVVLCGSAKTEPRMATLTDWGRQVLARRLDLVGPTDRSLTYEGKGSAASMQASSSMAIARILNEAGLRGDGSVKPESVRAWAGHRIWVETGRIESAAVALGCRSLDTTARIVGYQWAELA